MCLKLLGALLVHACATFLLLLGDNLTDIVVAALRCPNFWKQCVQCKLFNIVDYEDCWGEFRWLKVGWGGEGRGDRLGRCAMGSLYAGDGGKWGEINGKFQARFSWKWKQLKVGVTRWSGMAEGMKGERMLRGEDLSRVCATSGEWESTPRPMGRMKAEVDAKKRGGTWGDFKRGRGGAASQRGAILISGAQKLRQTKL